MKNQTHNKPQSSNTSNTRERQYDIIIVGAGFSGIGAAIKLKQHGFENYVILEKATDLGGTWRDNTYPGIAVDVVSFIYSYPFAQNPEWSRIYAPGAELKEYADDCAQRYGITQHIHYNKDVAQAVYEQQTNTWEIRLNDGEIYKCRFLVSACGLLVKPKMPRIAGINTFGGKLMHSARWDHNYELSNRRVAVIGTGASAIQIIPEIADKVENLYVFQRTPIWLLPKLDGKINDTLKTVFRKVPPIQKVVRIFFFVLTELTGGVGIIYYKKIPWLFAGIQKLAIRHIRKQISDPELQQKLTPGYTFFCKRPSFSNAYYPVFNKSNVELVTDGINQITEDAIVTKDGQVRRVDAIVCATGFQFFKRTSMPTFEVFGKNRSNLGDFWQKHRFQAYEGTTIPGFPNYFMIMGPYAIASASYFGMIDTQVHHLIRCLKEAKRRKANYVEVTLQALKKSQLRVEKQMANTVFVNGKCGSSNSYYFDRHGDTPLIRPVTYIEMWWKSRTFPMEHYIFDHK